MKKVLLTVSLFLVVALSFAQSSKYQKSMESNKLLLDSAKTSEDFTSVAASFERIAEAEKKEWLPYYYAALSNILKGFTDNSANKDELADKADGLLTKADAIEPKNSEVYLLKAMSATLHMLVDPMNRWQTYGSMQREALGTAKQFSPQNPRIYLFEGQSLLETPEQFGGGKAIAKPLFEKAIQLYKTEKPANNLYPNWGLDNAEQMLEKSK